MTPISSFINGQRIHWFFGPATRQNEEETVCRDGKLGGGDLAERPEKDC